MHHEASGLVDHDQMLVLEDDVQWNPLGAHHRAGLAGHLQLYSLPRQHFQRGLGHRLAVHELDGVGELAGRESRSAAVMVFDRSALSWTDPDRVAAFVRPRSDAVQAVATSDRDVMTALIRQQGLVDLVIPRGGPGLIRKDRR